MSKAKKIFTNIQVIILIIAIVLALIAIRPNPWNDGLAIRSVVKNSSASLAGIESPNAQVSPMERERVLLINNIPVKTVKEYYDITSVLKPNMSVVIKTSKDTYRLVTATKYNITTLNETEEIKITESMFDSDLNKTVNVTKLVSVPKTRVEVLGVEDLGLGLYDAPKTNLRQGLDLSGGSRIVLKPVQETTPEVMSSVIDSINLRLNAFGLTDVSVRPASDLEGHDFIIVEIAGTTKDELESLARQGNFEAKIGNDTAFKGDGDITYICRTADCSGIDPQTGCSQVSAGLWACRFTFSISLKPEAAQRQADITKNLEILIENNQNYLSLPIDLYLDNELVDSLKIGAELKGNPVTTISISGSGEGVSEQSAMTEALSNMRKLQAILSTGSLPVDLEIVKADTISPSLGEEFLENALLIGIVALIAVVSVVFIRYRRFIISLPMVFIMLAELLIFLGIAALIGWNLDVAAVAGIIIAIGTGVNDQIVIADETMRGSKDQSSNVKDKIKKAFFIIFTAYVTIVVAMLPLWFAGAGLLKGFAVTTILGVSVGVFITRPAYARIIEILYEKE